MLNIIFLNDSKNIYNGSFSRVNDHVVSISGVPAIAGGFTATRIGKDDAWNYSEYSTIYRQTYTAVVFSSDGSVYVEPTVEVKGTVIWNDSDDEDGLRPESVTIVLSNGISKTTNADVDWAYDFGEFYKKDDVKIEEVTGIDEEVYSVNVSGNNISASYTTISATQEMKVTECNNSQQAIIAAGTNITLSDGTVEHFTLTDHDQASLEGLAILVAQGQEQIPWHTSDQSEQCKYYSNADMSLITAGAIAYVTYHVTYFRDLRIYIRDLDDKATINSIVYGIDLPEEYKSEVLKDLEKQLAATTV